MDKAASLTGEGAGTAAGVAPATAAHRGELPPGAPLPDLDVRAIQRMLPHRYPMLMLDRLVEGRAFERAVGIKNVASNEPFFQGHFPGDPLMPGVLVIEALAQAAAAHSLASLGVWDPGNLVYFMGVDEVRFRRQVRPGDTLRLEVELVRRRLSVWKYKAAARVTGELAAEAVLVAKLVEGKA